MLHQLFNMDSALYLLSLPLFPLAGFAIMSADISDVMQAVLMTFLFVVVLLF